MTIPRSLFRTRSIVAALSFVAVSSCADSSTAPSNVKTATVRLTANVAGTPINTLVVTVSAADFSKPLVFNLEVNNNLASGAIQIPAGDARLFSVKAYDSFGEVTHEGSKTADVKHGQNPPVSIPLTPRNGQQPIDISMGDFSVVITPGEQVVNIGQTTQLSVQVTAPNGDHPDPTVLWATNDPSIATVSGGGVVTAKRGGAVDIVATYGGVAGIAKVIVRDPNAPLSYEGPLYPPPGNVTFTPGATGNSGLAGGITNTYRNFDLSITRYLAFGSDANDLPAVMFNNVAGNNTVDPSARMVFTTDGTDPNAGKMMFIGQTLLPLAGGGTLPVLTRFTLTLTQVVGGVETPLLLEPAPGGFSSVIGGVAKITNPYTVAGDAMHANLLFEASTDNGTTWGPALDVFNNNHSKAATATTLISFRGGFYYSY
jgi:Big-like domain-containing protein